MIQDWSIQPRSQVCSQTGNPFSEGDFFYTLLFDENLTLRREDLCIEAFKNRPSDAPKPVSFWRSKYELPPAKPPEALGKQTAEDLLRRYLADNSPLHTNACYILALMLERKRILKEVETREADGKLLRIYERAKTGEVFIIVDPRLRLEQVAEIQSEVAILLGAPCPPASPEPSSDASTEQESAPTTDVSAQAQPETPTDS